MIAAMKRHLACLFLGLACSPGLAMTIAEDDFESGTLSPLARAFGNESTEVRVVGDGDFAGASGADASSKQALLLRGGAETGWRPALEYRVPPLAGGWLRVKLQIKQTSLENSQLGLHVANGPDPYHIWANLVFNPTFIRVQNVSKGLGTTITQGADARWHTLDWTIPLPGNTEAETQFLFDGAEDNFLFKPVADPNEIETVNVIKIWSPRTPNTPDMTYLIDNVVIEHLDKLPSE